MEQTDSDCLSRQPRIQLEIQAKPLSYWCYLSEEIRLVNNSCGLTEILDQSGC